MAARKEEGFKEFLRTLGNPDDFTKFCIDSVEKIVFREHELGEKDLKQLEKNLYALRRGDVVISSGQPLAISTVTLDGKISAKKEVDRLLQKANYEAYKRVLPGKNLQRE